VRGEGVGGGGKAGWEVERGGEERRGEGRGKGGGGGRGEEKRRERGVRDKKGRREVREEKVEEGTWRGG